MVYLGGEHDLSDNIIHLVLAKVVHGGSSGSPPSASLSGGVKDISLFIVPKFNSKGERNDWKLIGVNHKLGFRAAVNTG
jgi:hypothetical protein